MLKRFFISMLGTIAGLWITIGILVVVIISIAGAVMASSSTPKIKDSSILYINLGGPISEYYTAGSISDIVNSGGITDNAALCDILDAIRLAKDDDKIKGIYIDCDGAEAGYATREEIISALADFKKCGKWIYAYADSYSQGDYMIAAQADSLFINPFGDIDVRGIGLSIPMYKGLMDKVGVKMNIVKVGTFKSAVEPFILTEISEPNRLQYKAFTDSLWHFTQTTIAKGRNVGAAAVNAWADSIISTRTADEYIASGAASALAYRRAVEQRLRKLTGIADDDDEGLRLVTPAEYIAQHESSITKDADHIAVLYAEGDIVDDGDQGIVGRTLAPQIIDLADDEHVKALVMRVNSGGGSAFASEQIWEALEYFKSKDKPFYVSMGDYAASGGYYISCGADAIYADATTLTGSIGVFGMIPDLSELATDKLGLHFSSIKTNDAADMPAIYSPLPDNQRRALQRSVDNIYETFVGRVATGRDMPADSVKAIAEGRVWVGSQAVRLGLVDKIGTLRECIAAIAGKVGLKDTEVVSYPDVEPDIFVAIAKQLQDANAAAYAAGIDSNTLRQINYIRRLLTANHIQARISPIVVY